MRAVGALLLVITSLLAGQSTKTSSGAVLPLPILKLTVEGNRQLAADAILQVAGLKVGDTASGQAFDAARQKIEDTGFFDGVGYEFAPARGPRPGYAATFEVKEAKPLYKVQFAGFPAKDEELNSYLKSREPLYIGFAPPTQPVIERFAKFLDAWSASKNQPKRIIGKLVAIGANDYIVQFQPDEPLPAVARVEFTGNQAIDSLALQNTIGAVAYGLPFSEQGFREFLDNQVKPLYEARGMLRVRFEDVTTEPVPPPVKGLLVHVKVIEGSVYKLGKVTFAGVKPEDKENLAHVAGLKTGEVANFDAIGQSAEKVKKSVRRLGYFHVSTTVERKVDQEAKKVDVTINVERGPKFEFGKLIIQGLDLNGEAAVRKQWGKETGDPFNPDYPDYFLAEIKDQGIFDHLGPTRSEVKTNDDSRVADVTLVFLPEEKKPPEKRKRESSPF